MKKSLIICMAFFFVCTLGSAQDCDRVFEKTHATPGVRGGDVQGSITTMFAWNGGYAGNTFDITANVDIYCDGIDVNWISAGETITVEMYYKTGTAYGYETDPGAWTLLGTNSAAAAGPDLPTWIDLSGNGILFAENHEMGCAVHVNNYPDLYGFLGYTNGTWIFSNDDITELEVHHGLADPVFSYGFYPRCWNGTFHYNMTGIATPLIDVKCNGEDDRVEIYDGANCTLTLDVTPRDFAGYPAEIWVLGMNKTTGGIFTYGEYPSAIWLPGANNAFFGGGLIDISETCLDQPLPIGSYEVYGAYEFLVNGQLNLPFVYKYDLVDFEVIEPPTDYKWDTGTTNNLLCWVSGGDIVGMHCFDTIPGGEVLKKVGTIFGSAMYHGYAPGNGTRTAFYVWEATNFGDPTTATLLAQGTSIVQNVDTDIHWWDSCPCIVLEPNFWIAYNLRHDPYEYCLSIDDTNLYVQGAAFYAGTNTKYGFDPTNLYINQYPPDESPYGFWTVRAEY